MYVSLAAAVGTVECCVADNIYFCTLATGCPCRTHLSTGPTAELSLLARGCAFISPAHSGPGKHRPSRGF